MYLEQLEITNFRNYKNTSVTFSPHINIIYGNNAQGKTNLLEAIYFLAMTKSHRLNLDNDLIKRGEETLYIKGYIKNKENINKYEIGFNNSIKKIKIDNNIIKKISNYISNINVIIFNPEDLNIIKGSPKERRRFLNLELSQFNSNYLEILNDYNKLLKIRNNILKKGIPDNNYLEILNEYLINKATDIYISRSKFINKLNEYNNKIYKSITKIEGFNLVYKPNIAIEEYDRENIKKTYKNALDNNLKLDLKLGMTLLGPHKDDFIININDEELKNYGSQGQQRVAILTIKLSELKVLEKYQKKYPILLLDDVFSELDNFKKNSLLKYFMKKNQTIITTTDLKNIDEKILKISKKIKIKQGEII